MRVMGMRVLPVALLVAYAALLLVDLERFPAINPDEPGYAEPAWTLITRGEFGAPMRAGMFGQEHRIYTNWPGRGVTTVLPYALIGPTLAAARVASVVMALLLALLSALVLRRVLERPLEWLDWFALVAVFTSPVVVVAGRFARPEIDVAAWTMAMILCLEAASREGLRLRRRGWAVAGGVCAGIAFMMHQYGAISLGVGVFMAARRWGGASEWRIANTGWMAAGAFFAVLPWMAFILADLPEFRRQFGAAVENQAWRYPPNALARTVVNEIPGRYVLDRQDYPDDWDPWAEASRLLVPSVSTSESLWPLRLVVRLARRPLELDPNVRDRIWWCGLLIASTGVATVETYRRRATGWWLFLGPGIVWVVALSLVPNKWLGYAVTPTVLVGLGGYVATVTHPGSGRVGRLKIIAVAALTVALNGTAIAHGWLSASATRADIVIALHDAIPPGARVLIPFREWYVFVGRNQAIGLEGRSLPMFGTSIKDSAESFGVEYVVLVRPTASPDAYFWVDAADRSLDRLINSASVGSTEGTDIAHASAGEVIPVRRVRRE